MRAAEAGTRAPVPFDDRAHYAAPVQLDVFESGNGQVEIKGVTDQGDDKSDIVYITRPSSNNGLWGVEAYGTPQLHGIEARNLDDLGAKIADAMGISGRVSIYDSERDRSKGSRAFEYVAKTPPAGPKRGGTEPVSASSVQRVVGKDISRTVDYKALPASYNAKTGENDALKTIIKRQGFDGPSKVVSEADFDAAVHRGDVRETWRGIATPVGKDPATLAEQFRSGDFYVGLGINGDGTYLAMNKADGQQYGGTLLRIGLAKDAKVVGAADLDKEMDAYFASLPARRKSAELARLDAKLVRDLAGARTDQDRANFRRKYRDQVFGLDPDPSIAAQRDPGVFAALRGYDAIEIPKDRSPDSHHEMILLNRAATIVQGNPERAGTAAPRTEAFNPRVANGGNLPPRREGETDGMYNVRVAPDDDAAERLLNGYSIPGLKAMARDAGVPGAASMSKSKLVAALMLPRRRYWDSIAIGQQK